MYALHTETIEHEGHSFQVEHFADEYADAPWVREDGHGIISDWTRRDKRPGEVSICEDRGSHRYYDVQATMKIARRDGWGLGPEDVEALARKLKRTPTAGDIVAESVRMDMDRMRRWCNDDWHYVGVVVTLLTEDGDPLESRSESLWGIESDCTDYLREVAHEIAEQIDVSPVEV